MAKAPAAPSHDNAILAVSDVAKTIDFYKDVLGFPDSWLWGTPPTFGGVCWEDVNIMFCLQPELAAKIEGHQHSIFVHGVDELYARHRRKKATIVSPIGDKPWGLREYTVRDLNGYHLRIGEGREGPVPGKARDLPSGVKIITRRPTVAEYRSLIEAVGWSRYSNPTAAKKAIAGALHMVVAEHKGKAIGTGAVLGDGATFFYIKDIMVQPAWQKKGVGTAMMDALVAWLNKNAPKKALITLFTGRNLKNYYARYGFQGPETYLYGMAMRRRSKPLRREK